MSEDKIEKYFFQKKSKFITVLDKFLNLINFLKLILKWKSFIPYLLFIME